MGCTKQNGDAARKGCIAVLLVWFTPAWADLPRFSLLSRHGRP
jgi:hypothetical protein